jgi:hypothetical protein
MIGINSKRFTTEQVNPELDKSELHRKKLLVVNGIIPFWRSQLSRLVRYYPLLTLIIVL